MENDVISLLELVKGGDESAFAELCEKYRTLTESAAYRFAPSFKGDGADGEYGIDDLKQYAAMALYRAAITYEADTHGKGKEVSFGLYAKICVNNALISALRKYRGARRKAERAAMGKAKMASNNKNPDVSSDPLDKLVSSESEEQLIKRICVVLSDYEEKIFRYYTAGKSVHEIAKGLGKSEKSVSNAIYRIKAKIKGLLKNQ